MPTPSGPLNSPSHSMLHNMHVNVKAYGAVGDGTTDDTAAIQAALNAAQSPGGGICFFPPGNYKITSSLLYEGNGVTGAEGCSILGANGTDSDPSPGTWNKPGVRIFGTFNDYLLKRVSSEDGGPVVAGGSYRIHGIGFQNLHATGKCLYVSQWIGGSVNNCWFRGFKGVHFGSNVFSTQMNVCSFSGPGHNIAGSRAIIGNIQARDIDITQFEQGVTGNLVSISGFRVENCVYAFYLGVDHAEIVNTWNGVIQNGSTEACDYGYFVRKGAGVLMNASANGTPSSPSGQGVGGFVTQEREYGLTLINCSTSGTHTKDFDFQNNATVNHTTVVGCRGNSGVWDIGNYSNLEIINCANGISDIRRLPVIATASLPAASTAQDGRAIIENNGTGDRNLIIYAGGQRFRIDGGAAF